MQVTTLWKIRVLLMVGIFGSLAVFLGGGALLDFVWGSWPKGFLAGLIVSFPVSNLVSIRLAKRSSAPSA